MSKSNSSKFNIFSKGDNVSHRTGELHFTSYTASQGNGMILFTHNGTANNRNLDFRIDNSSKLKIDNTKIEINTHILPSSNALYDLGSAEYKIRHLFLSDNSLWIGDAHKISIDNGQMKFRKRKTNVMPKSIQNTFPGENDEAKRIAAEQHRENWAAANASGVTLQNMKLNHWEAYAKTIDGINSKGLGLAEVNDIFRTNEVDDYEEQFGSNSWIESGANIHTLVTNVGIGVANPKTRLEIDGTVTTKKYRQKFIVKAAGGKYHINGRVNPILSLQRGKEYEFDLTDSSTNGHPFYITHSSNGGSNGSTGAIAKKYDTQDGLNMVTGNGNHAGTTNKTVIFSVPDNAPGSLYYHCSAHSGMGNKINIDGTLLSDSLGKTRITVDATSNENIIRFNTNNEERVKIENDKTVFKFPVELQSSGDIALKIKADTDNVDENDNALLVLSQDNDTVKMEMGGVGSGGQIYTNSLANAQYIMANSTNSAINTSLQFVTKDGSNPLTSRMTISHNGKVGLGTNNPGTVFEINDSQPYITLRNNQIEITDGGFESKIIFENHSGNSLAQIQGSHDGIGNDTRGDLIFSTNNNSSLVERMRIDSNGNVGIGLTPQYSKLQLDGNILLTGGNNGYYFTGSRYIGIHGTNGTLGSTGFSGIEIESSSQSQNVHIHSHQAGYSSTKRMTILNNGNVGIGDNNPGTQLQITGSEPYITLKNSTDENNDGGCESRIIFEDHSNTALGQIQCSHNGINVDTRSDLIFSTNNGSLGEKMRIDSDGNIGIGITTPHAKLQINNSNPYTLGEFDYDVDSIFLYGHDSSSNGTRFGGITWGHPNHRRRAGISAITESTDSDFIGLSFCTQGTDGSGPFAESMRIRHNGRVGINETNPAGVFHVKNIDNTIYYADHYVIGSGSGAASQTSGAVTLNDVAGIFVGDLLVTNHVRAGGSQSITSDRRIKKDIIDSNDNSCLEKIRLIENKKYKYIDFIQKGITTEVYGFIAQQVKQIIPEAITIHEDYIPNIMMVGTVEQNVNNSNQYYITTTNNFNLERQKSDDTKIKSYSYITTDTETKPFEHILKLVSIISENKVLIECTDNLPNTIFVLGELIYDFHCLKKDVIFTVAVGALQEIDRQQQADKAKITNLENEVTILKNENTILKSQYNDLLNRIIQLENK